jgi:hypothetical protein
MSESVNNIIKGAIVLGVIAITLIFIIPLFSEQIIPGFQNLFGTKLSDVQIQGSDKNFNSLMNNIQNCYLSEDINCFCEGFPNYPATFPLNTNLNFKIEGTDTTVGLYSGKTKLFEEKTAASILTTLIIEDNGKQSFDFNTALNNYNFNNKNLDYSKNLPFLSSSILKEGPRLISGLLYKEKSDRIYLLLTDNSNIQELKMDEIPYCNLEKKGQLIS